jgi:tetratricopeptide (TPR) repeat protein
VFVVCDAFAGEGAACAALAHSFKELGQTDLAVSYLEKYQAIAQRNKQSVAQAEACAALGSIHSAASEHQAAVGCFEKTFDIARTVGDRKLIDSARINLGMARGNMAMSRYMAVVKDNLPALLNWKTRRQAFKQ